MISQGRPQQDSKDREILVTFTQQKVADAQKAQSNKSTEAATANEGQSKYKNALHDPFTIDGDDTPYQNTLYPFAGNSKNPRPIKKEDYIVVSDPTTADDVAQYTRVNQEMVDEAVAQLAKEDDVADNHFTQTHGGPVPDDKLNDTEKDTDGDDITDLEFQAKPEQQHEEDSNKPTSAIQKSQKTSFRREKALRNKNANKQSTFSPEPEERDASSFFSGFSSKKKDGMVSFLGLSSSEDGGIASADSSDFGDVFMKTPSYLTASDTSDSEPQALVETSHEDLNHNKSNSTKSSNGSESNEHKNDQSHNATKNNTIGNSNSTGSKNTTAKSHKTTDNKHHSADHNAKKDAHHASNSGHNKTKEKKESADPIVPSVEARTDQSVEKPTAGPEVPAEARRKFYTEAGKGTYAFDGEHDWDQVEVYDTSVWPDLCK